MAALEASEVYGTLPLVIGQPGDRRVGLHGALQCCSFVGACDDALQKNIAQLLLAMEPSDRNLRRAAGMLCQEGHGPVWDAVLDGTDEGDGWVRMNARYLLVNEDFV